MLLDDKPSEHDKNKTKKLAVLSMLLAVSVILLIVGTVISVNTVFFTALAAFMVGFSVINYGFGAGVMLFFGASILDLILNPDKLHVFLYIALAGFILVSEGSYKLMEKYIADDRKRGIIHLIIRFIIFMAGYVPIVICLPRLIVTGDVADKVFSYDYAVWILIGVGVIGFVVYDMAYIFAKRTYMSRFRL